MADYVGNDEYDTQTLIASGVADMALSPDQSTLYVAMKDGSIRIYDAATGQLTATWTIGTSLGAISVSEDGSTLLVVETSPPEGQSVVYQIVTGDGSSETRSIAGTAFRDVEIVNAETAIITGGQGEVTLFDLDTASFSTLSGGVYYGNYSTLVEDGRYTLFAEPGISNGPLFLYDDQSGQIVAAGDNYQSPYTGFNFGSQAVSEVAGLVVQFRYHSSVNVYDLNLDYVTTFDVGGTIDGLAFDPTGQYLYAYVNSGKVVKYAVGSWDVVEEYAVTGSGWHNNVGYGSQILANESGDIFVLDYDSEGGRLQLIDLSTRNETFEGTLDADSFAGGLGDDVYVVNHVGDLIIEDAHAGTDLANSSINYELAANVENLTLTGADAIDGIGNALANVIHGNDGQNSLHGLGGDDALYGGVGDDWIDGGDGADLLDGGAGADTVSYAASATSVWVELLRNYAEDDYLVRDTLIGIENVIGTEGDDHFLGDFADNQFIMGAGDDVGFGHLGSDFLYGEAGNDTVVGNEGDDRLYGGEGNDNVQGDDGNDIVDGGSGNDWLVGNPGDDRLVGGAGDDQLNGSEGTDTADYGDAEAAVTVDLRKTGPQITGAGIDTLVNIENVDGSTFGDIIRGNDAVNTLFGMDGADKLYGYGGDDTLDGGNGDDFLYGLDGNDSLTGSAGYDRMYGGVGDDTYYAHDATDFAYELAGEGTDLVVASIDHQLRDHVENLELTGSAIVGKGNALGNAITGNDGVNKLYGYDGEDVLDGGAGDDYLAGHEGNDTLIGGAGYDKMYGGAGHDLFIVTDATDFAYENAGEGYDTVFASLTHTLRANIEELQLTGSADIRGYGNGEHNLIIGNSGANLLYGRDGNDTLRGNAGNDLLYGENGNDRLDGGAGQDRYYGAAGADQFIFDDGDFAVPTPDRIMDFSQLEGDLIDLGAVDANTLLAGDQGFSFLGSNAFTGTAGELRTFQASGTTYLQGDTNGDGTGDFLIRIDGLHTLQASDFII